MELLFFLVILGIQFTYQIYQAVNRRKQKRLQAENPSSDPSEDSVEEWSAPEEHSTLSPDPVDQAYQVKRKRSHDFYNQFFGFIEEPSEVSPEKNYTRVSETIRDPTQYVEDTPEEEFFSPEGEGTYSYDDYHDDKTTSPREDTSFHQKRKFTASPEIQPLLKKPPLRNIRQQLKHPQSFRNAWRIKFILDRPPALSRNRDFF